MRISSSTFGKIRIGKGTTINSCWYSNKAGGGQKKTSLIAEGGEISIGKNVGISNSTIYSRKNIIIEDNVMVGVNCVIYDTDFHSIYIEDQLNENINIIDKPVRIKSGAWIGGHSIILKGVTIGKNSVIGAGSIVTHDIPDNEVWAGNPAKYIKKFKIY
ncbi:MAG: acyltransferase [Anaerobutyricum sp.]